MDDKTGLPPYSRLPRRSFRWRRFVTRYGVLALLALLLLCTYKKNGEHGRPHPGLSVDKLYDDLETCKKLHARPTDPIGLGRTRNARYLDGAKPTLIRNATIWVGEPAEGSSEEDVRSGAAWSWVHGDVLLEYGLIQRVEADIPDVSLPEDTTIYNAYGRPLTAGIIDMHSHAGVDSLPEFDGSSDFNEMSDNITPWARSKDGLLPLDHQIQVIKSGGVTTSLVLPGSANNIGGEAFVFKHAVGKHDGRSEISAADMLVVPEGDDDAGWRYMKMACGENAKNWHTNTASSRMGESFAYRQAFEHTRKLIQQQDDWCRTAASTGVKHMKEYLPQDLKWEALGAALRGQVHVNIHCYTIPDLEAMVDHTNEFQFQVRAFHHAHQTYLVPEILRRTWGGRVPSSAIFADNMYYKAEAYVASEFAGKYLYDEGLTPVYVSDNPVLSAQHVVFEAAKGYRYGLPYHAALSSVTTAPAENLGLGQRLGKIKPGFDADVVVWDSDPLSVGAAPAQVWIDGTAQFEDPVVLDKPYDGPIVPNKALGKVIEEPIEVPDVVFKGITEVLLKDSTYSTDAGPLTVVVSGGKISCVGACNEEVRVAASAGVQTVELENGHLHHSFVAVGGTLGLNEIDAEDSTDNGASQLVFSRAVDGLRFGGKKLRAGYKAGVTRAISAPVFRSAGTHHGTSVGFATSGQTSLEEGAVFAHDAAVHYTYTTSVKAVTGSVSVAFGGLRLKLFSLKNSDEPLPYSEDFFLKEVLNGNRTLVLTIKSADAIAAALRVKKDVEAFYDGQLIKLAILGGAEAYLVADELAEAGVGVILSPLLDKGESWEARRSLTGAPLTNGTNIDRLLDAGVKVAVGLDEDWEVRDLGFSAGIAYANGEGRLSKREAVDLVSTNVFEILGVEVPSAVESGHWVVSEGSPLDISSRVRAVASGRDEVAVFV